MICKKCGRECDIRAEKALRWMKFFFLSLLAFVAIAWIASFFLNPESRIGFVDFCARRILVGATGLPFYQPFTILSFFVIVSLCIAIYKCSKWLIHAEKELNRVSKVKFVPWEDISSALILPLFPFIHFFIFKELLTRQKETLDKNNLESALPPQWALPGILGGGIAIYASFFLMLNNRNPVLSHISIGCFIAFIIFLFRSYVTIIRTINANTRSLYSLPEAVSTADTPTDTSPTDASSDTAASTESDNGIQAQNSDKAEANMICEETKPVNPDTQSQNFLDKDFQENVLRGKKLIDRSKKTISIILKADILLFFVFITGICLNSNFLLGLCFLAYPILSLLIFFMLFSAVSIYCKWLYHILRNLRKFTGTHVSPKIAVVYSLLPGIGQLLTYFIFKDILTHQKEVLDTHRTDTSSIPTSTPVSPLLLGLGSLIIFIIFKIITLETVKEIAGYVAFMAFFFPVIPYFFIFKVVFDIFAIITLLIYMKLVQQPILNEKAIAQLNIGNIKATNPDKEINPEINGSPAENDEIPQDNP